MSRHRLPGAVIAAVLYPVTQAGDGRLRRVERHARGLRDRVGVDLEHAGTVGEHALHHRLLARVVQPTDMQDRRDLTGLGGGASDLSRRHRSHPAAASSST